MKARLRDSCLLAPSGRGASSRNLAFAFSCMSVLAEKACFEGTKQKSARTSRLQSDCEGSPLL